MLVPLVLLRWWKLYLLLEEEFNPRLLYNIENYLLFVRCALSLIYINTQNNLPSQSAAIIYTKLVDIYVENTMVLFLVDIATFEVF